MASNPADARRDVRYEPDERPPNLLSLGLVSSLFQFALAARLSALRRIFTPTAAGAVVMLIPVTVAPLILGKLTDVPAGASSTTGSTRGRA